MSIYQDCHKQVFLTKQTRTGCDFLYGCTENFHQRHIFLFKKIWGILSYQRYHTITEGGADYLLQIVYSCVLLHNCHTCIQALGSKYFGVLPPTLQE